MSLADLFKAKENESLKLQVSEREKEIEVLNARIAELEQMLTPEVRDSIQLTDLINRRKEELKVLKDKFAEEESEARKAIAFTLQELNETRDRLNVITADYVEMSERVLMQSFGIYEPKYDFANSSEYKDELAKIRNMQKDMAKNGTATSCYTTWTVSGSREKGARMIRDLSKLLLRAFNTECDDAISSVKFNNIETIEKRIATAQRTITHLGATIGDIYICDAYVDLKIKELYLAYEYQVAKQKEKERLRELRAEEKERAKLEKEIQEARKKIEKEQKHYSKALETVLSQIKEAGPNVSMDLLEKKKELEDTMGQLAKSMEQIDYREANQKAGYVYIISNIGAFGENVYKIGMTRRLEPMDRIDELGDASVPFDFDVHALIFSDDAPALEAALHNAFADKKINMVNTRREFFRVSLDEIKKIVTENFDKTVEFIDIPDASQYRQSELIRNSK